MKWKAEKWLFLMVLSYLKNNKNSRTYRCSNIAKNRVFRTFRLGLLENLSRWSNSEPGFGFYAKKYFGNDYRNFYSNHNLIFSIPVLYSIHISIKIGNLIYLLYCLCNKTNMNLATYSRSLYIILIAVFAERGRKRHLPLTRVDPQATKHGTRRVGVSPLSRFDFTMSAVETRSRIMFLLTSCIRGAKQTINLKWQNIQFKILALFFRYFDIHLPKINIWKIFVNCRII